MRYAGAAQSLSELGGLGQYQFTWRGLELNAVTVAIRRGIANCLLCGRLVPVRAASFPWCRSCWEQGPGRARVRGVDGEDADTGDEDAAP
jgi:hypothetical protein